MDLGPAEIAGLVAGMGLALKIIDKLVDAVVTKVRKGNGTSPPTDGAMREVAQGLQAVAQGQAAIVGKLDRICDLSSDLKEQQSQHEVAVERRFDGLHRRLDKVKGG
jgi:phage-related minor tail protein